MEETYLNYPLEILQGAKVTPKYSALFMLSDMDMVPVASNRESPLLEVEANIWEGALAFSKSNTGMLMIVLSGAAKVCILPIRLDQKTTSNIEVTNEHQQIIFYLKGNFVIDLNIPIPKSLARSDRIISSNIADVTSELMHIKYDYVEEKSKMYKLFSGVELSEVLVSRVTPPSTLKEDKYVTHDNYQINQNHRY